MTRAALLFTRDLGSRVRAHPSASPQDRAASPTGLSRQGPSSQSGIALRGALRFCRDLAGIGFIFALAVLA